MNFAFSSPAENLEAASAAWLRDLEEQGCSPRTITGYALTVRDFIECFATEEDNPGAPSYADVLLWAQTFDARGLPGGHGSSILSASAPFSPGRANMAGIRSTQS